MTRTDDLERMLLLLSDAPEPGFTREEIYERLKATGETWSYRTIEDSLCDLGTQVKFVKVRVKGGKKVTKFSIRRV